MWRNRCIFFIRFRKISSKVNVKISRPWRPAHSLCVPISPCPANLPYLNSIPTLSATKQGAIDPKCLFVSRLDSSLLALLLKSLETTCTSIFSHVAIMANFFLGFRVRTDALALLTGYWLGMTFLVLYIPDLAISRTITIRTLLLNNFCVTRLTRAAISHTADPAETFINLIPFSNPHPS